MDIIQGRPFTGRLLEKVKKFLASLGLEYDDGVEFSLCVEDDEGAVVAAGSRQGPVLKCIGVSGAHQGEGLAATVVSELVSDGIRSGFSHLFVFTKPSNRAIFDDLGFFPMVQTADVLLMENRRGGVAKFVESLECPVKEGVIGAVVVNCNPFTKGHQYLMETAASQCDFLHIFVLSAEKSLFPAPLRLEMVKRGTAHLKNAAVHPTGDYLISAATFPDYFLKERARVDNVKCELDLAIFARCFAKPLNITRRYVGTEPLSPVTNRYNEAMKSYLPRQGVQVIEIPRREAQGAPISATRVRALLESGDLANPLLLDLLPETTLELIRTKWKAL